MFSKLNDHITMTPCTPKITPGGGITIQWGEKSQAWAWVSLSNVHFKKPGLPLWPPLPQGRVTGCYDIVIRQEEMPSPIGKISWKDKTLYPIDMPSLAKEEGYVSFKAVEMGGVANE